MVKLWILFSRRGVADAQPILEEAERHLDGRTYVDQANIQLIKGRFARQLAELEFTTSIDHIREAILIFDRNDDDSHPIRARVYVHWAFCLLLQSQLRKGQSPSDLELNRQTAYDALNDAQTICGADHPKILDRVHYCRAAWELFLGGKKFKQEADRAFKVAESISDRVIMSHVNILRCQYARNQNAPEDAQEWALGALRVADKTDNRRVGIRARIWCAMTQADHPLYNYDRARVYQAEAEKHLLSSDNDYLASEMEDLKKHLSEPKVKNRIVFPDLTVEDVLADCTNRADG
jgi:hypothetical protein